MPDLAETPKLEALEETPKDFIRDNVMSPIYLADVGSRIGQFFSKMEESNEPPNSQDAQTAINLAKVGLHGMNNLLITRPALLQDEAIGGAVNEALANLRPVDDRPDPDNLHQDRVITKIISPLGLGISVDRALDIINKDKTKPDYYRLLGKIAGGSFKAISEIKTADIEAEADSGIETETTKQKPDPRTELSEELERKIAAAIDDFDKNEYETELSESIAA